jgi:hypothetical protein
VEQESFPVITSGVFFYQLRIGSYINTKKMLLIKKKMSPDKPVQNHAPGWAKKILLLNNIN